MHLICVYILNRYDLSGISVSSMEGRQLWLPYFDRKSTFTFIVLNVALMCVYMFGYLPNQQERDMPSMSRGTATVTLNKATVSRPHPFIVRTPDKRTEAVAAKFRSLSSRTLDMWWDDGAVRYIGKLRM